MGFALALTACATAPHRFDQDNSGRWKARTLIKDIKNKRSHIVYAEILAQKPHNLRVDVTTSLGVHLARMTLNDDTLSFILTREKKYFTGPATPRALGRVLSMPLDPKLLVDVLFDIEPTGDGWSCERKKDFLKSCASAEGVKIDWTERELERRTVSIVSPNGQLQLNLQGYQANVQATPENFTIKPPASFKQIQLQE